MSLSGTMDNIFLLWSSRTGACLRVKAARTGADSSRKAARPEARATENMHVRYLLAALNFPGHFGGGFAQIFCQDTAATFRQSCSGCLDNAEKYQDVGCSLCVCVSVYIETVVCNAPSFPRHIHSLGRIKRILQTCHESPCLSVCLFQREPSGAGTRRSRTAVPYWNSCTKVH